MALGTRSGKEIHAPSLPTNSVYLYPTYFSSTHSWTRIARLYGWTIATYVKSGIYDKPTANESQCVQAVGNINTYSGYSGTTAWGLPTLASTINVNATRSVNRTTS